MQARLASGALFGIEKVARYIDIEAVVERIGVAAVECSAVAADTEPFAVAAVHIVVVVVVVVERIEVVVVECTAVERIEAVVVVVVGDKPAAERIGAVADDKQAVGAEQAAEHRLLQAEQTDTQARAHKQGVCILAL